MPKPFPNKFWLLMISFFILSFLALFLVTKTAAETPFQCPPACTSDNCAGCGTGPEGEKYCEPCTRGMCSWDKEAAVCVSVGQRLGLEQKDLVKIVYDIVRYLLGLAGLVATIVIIIGGYYWMTAAGNEERVGKAKNLIYGGIIGLAIVILAYAILVFVVGMIMGTPTV